jgi:hypothetical protein
VSDKFPQNHFPVLEMPESKEGKGAAKEEEKDPNEAKEEAKAEAADAGASTTPEKKPVRKLSNSEKKANTMASSLLV